MPGILAEIGRGEADGVDGYVIACFGDPGLEAARELAARPVVGIAEAGHAHRDLPGPRRSASSPRSAAPAAGPGTSPRRYGVARACRGVHACDIPVLELETSPDARERITAGLPGGAGARRVRRDRPRLRRHGRPLRAHLRARRRAGRRRRGGGGRHGRGAGPARPADERDQRVRDAAGKAYTGLLAEFQLGEVPAAQHPPLGSEMGAPAPIAPQLNGPGASSPARRGTGPRGPVRRRRDRRRTRSRCSRRRRSPRRPASRCGPRRRRAVSVAGRRRLRCGRRPGAPAQRVASRRRPWAPAATMTHARSSAVGTNSGGAPGWTQGSASGSGHGSGSGARDGAGRWSRGPGPAVRRSEPASGIGTPSTGTSTPISSMRACRTSSAWLPARNVLTSPPWRCRGGAASRRSRRSGRAGTGTSTSPGAW